MVAAAMVAAAMAAAAKVAAVGVAARVAPSAEVGTAAAGLAARLAASLQEEAVAVRCYSMTRRCQQRWGSIGPSNQRKRDAQSTDPPSKTIARCRNLPRGVAIFLRESAVHVLA